MGVTQSYSRAKDPAINATGMDLTLFVGEEPDAPTAIGGTGNTGVLDARLEADADESGGVDVQDLFRLRAVPSINSAGVAIYTVTVTPVLGDGTDGTPASMTVTHDETIDAWQTAAGRPRQV